MIRRPPRSTLFPYTTPLPISLSFSASNVGQAFAHPITLSARSKSDSGTVSPTVFRDTRSVPAPDRKSTRLNSSHLVISYAVFCLKKKKRHHAARVQYDHALSP